MNRPIRIRMRETVRPDFLFLLPPESRDMVARSGQEYPVSVNQNGAVCVIFPDGEKLGVKPDEFEVVAYEEI